jgi:hypothetical protein
MPPANPGVVKEIHILSQNVNRNRLHINMLLETLKDSYNIIFVQEPPWKVTCKTVPTRNPHGDNDVSAPKHPDWLYIVQPMVRRATPHIMAYIHNCLAHLCLALRCNIIDHRDILILSLHPAGDTVNLMNVYSDNHNYAICRLYEEVDSLPAFHYMGGDFNCHSEVWDSNVLHHRWAAQHLLSIVNNLGLEWACPSNHGLTHILHNSELDGLVINLMFTIPDPDGCFLPRIVHDLRGPSDHSPIASVVLIAVTDICIKHTVLPKNSEEEKEFLSSTALSIKLLFFFFFFF